MADRDSLDVDTYFPAVKIGEVMRGFVLARVIASKNSQIEVGDTVLSDQVGWREEAILKEEQFQKAPELGPGSEITDLLGIYHWTGLTAYFGLNKIGQPKPGETVVISGAAGATGSVAGQIAKIAGARVVGIVGSDEKCEWIKELGFDVALNYKDPDFKSQFEEATPDLIDVFFDNGKNSPITMARKKIVLTLIISRRRDPRSGPLESQSLFSFCHVGGNQSIQLGIAHWPQGMYHGCHHNSRIGPSNGLARTWYGRQLSVSGKFKT
ncbi:hypothetical protein NW767_010823 [Fusarium falciforme]|nr:hypothetical protein NW767_010823 [Fusarium falciforme]